MTIAKKVGILSTIDSPLLGYFIKSLTDLDCKINAVILDSSTSPKKELKIHSERTANKMPPLSIYDFEKLKVPFYFVKNHNSNFSLNLIKSLNLNLLINAGTPRILNKKILSSVDIGILNCHPGLLPKYRGCTCVEWAIYNDDQIGNTVHLMTERVDDGVILKQELLNFSKLNSYEDIRVKVYKSGLKLLSKTTRDLLQKKNKINHYVSRKKGKFYPIIDKKRMKIVINKINKGNYAFQK